MFLFKLWSIMHIIRLRYDSLFPRKKVALALDIRHYHTHTIMCIISLFVDIVNHYLKSCYCFHTTTIQQIGVLIQIIEILSGKKK